MIPFYLLAAAVSRQTLYHALCKDDKLLTDSLNNPLNDAVKAMELFYDEVNAFHSLSALQRTFMQRCLAKRKNFVAFFIFL